MNEGNSCLSVVSHRSLNETLKSSTFTTIKQIKIVAEFINKICLIKEHTATQILQTVETFRKKGAEIKEECQGIFCGISNTWDSLLKDTEAEAKELLEISQKLVSSISVPLFDRASKKKNLLKKIFTYRENLEIQLDKKEDSLNKCLKDYTESWSKYKLYSKDPQKEQHVSTICFNCHNDYVWQLSGFNKSNEVLYEILIPELLKDCQDTLNDIGVSYSSLMLKFSDIQQEKLKNRLENMQVIKAMFSSINAHNDISNYVQTLDSCSSKVPFRSHDSPDDTQTTDPLGVKILLNPLTEPALKRKYYLMSEKLSDVVNLVDKDQTALKSLMQLKNSYIDNPSYGNPDGMHEDVLKMILN